MWEGGQPGIALEGPAGCLAVIASAGPRSNSPWIALLLLQAAKSKQVDWKCLEQLTRFRKEVREGP